jgi:hypothetical protein
MDKIDKSLTLVKISKTHLLINTSITDLTLNCAHLLITMVRKESMLVTKISYTVKLLESQI